MPSRRTGLSGVKKQAAEAWVVRHGVGGSTKKRGSLVEALPVRIRGSLFGPGSRRSTNVPRQKAASAGSGGRRIQVVHMNMSAMDMDCSKGPDTAD
jgi:hypothetical protein